MTKKKWVVAAVMAAALTTVAGTAAFASTTSSSGAAQGQAASSKQANHANREHKGFAGDTSYLLSVLKVDQATLTQDLKSGMSLADIASKNGVSEQTVIDAVVAHEKAQLQSAVTAGKMTSDQVTKMEANLSDHAKKMVESKGMHGDFHGPKRGGFGFGFGPKDDSALLSLLKVDQTTLDQDRKAGMSLADIASKNGVSEQTVIDAVVAQQKANLAKAVTAGKLTSAQETKMEANLSTMAKKMVESKGFKGDHGPEGFGFGHGDDSYLLSVLKVDQTTLQQDRKSGMSLADIASKNGVSEQTVIDAVVAHEKAQLQSAVTAGKMTSAQETKIEANLSTQAKKMVESKGWQDHKQFHKQKQQATTNNSQSTQTTQATQE